MDNEKEINTHVIIAKLAKIEQKVDTVIEVVNELKTDMKKNRNDINDLDKRVSKLETFINGLLWAGIIVVGIILAALTYAGIQAFVDYVNTYGIP